MSQSNEVVRECYNCGRPRKMNPKYNNTKPAPVRMQPAGYCICYVRYWRPLHPGTNI